MLDKLEKDNEKLKKCLILAMICLRDISFYRNDDTIEGKWAMDLAHESLEEVNKVLND